jgi:hypothetical protein
VLEVNRLQMIIEAGQVYSLLTVVEYAGSYGGKGAMWLCKCACGGETVVRGVYLRSGNTKSCGHVGAPYMSGDDVGYHGMHNRVDVARGPASSYACLRCGGPAREWACTNFAKWEFSERRNIWHGYSTDVDEYDPLCTGCHRLQEQEMVAQLHADEAMAFALGL